MEQLAKSLWRYGSWKSEPLSSNSTLLVRGEKAVK